MEQEVEIIEHAFTGDLSDEITLTEKAASQVKKIMSDNNIAEGSGLRVGVKGGGCSGLQYVLGFETGSKETDKIIHKDGIDIFIDPKSLFYLSGAVIDYTDGLNGKGFTFNNPNATKSCGCGSSFS